MLFTPLQHHICNFDNLTITDHPLHRYRWLGANLLRGLPHEVVQLTCLKKLWIPSNALKELPKEVLSIHSLEWL